MARVMKRKIKKKEVPKTETAKKKSQDETVISPEKTLDFGGLPSRDLKKNLGC